MVGFVPSPLSTSCAGTFPRMWESIFSRCDLPDPKKPEIHAPFCSWFDGSLYESRNLSRFLRISSVSTYSLTSVSSSFSSLALITPLTLCSMSLLNSSLKLTPFCPLMIAFPPRKSVSRLLLDGPSFPGAHLAQASRTVVVVSWQTAEQRHGGAGDRASRERAGVEQH